MSSARSSRSFCTICLFGHVCAHSFFISKSIVPSRISEHLIMFNDKKWLQARLCFSIFAETLLDVFGDKQPTNLHPLSHRFQDFQSTEILWWITDHYSFGLSLFLTTNWVRVHRGTHSTLLFRSCCQAAQPGQQHESNWDVVLTLPSEKQVRPRAGTGYTLLQISWQACAQDHHHCRWSHIEQKQCLWNKRCISSNRSKHSPCSCHHSSVWLQNQNKLQLSRQIFQSLPQALFLYPSYYKVTG